MDQHYAYDRFEPRSPHRIPVYHPQDLPHVGLTRSGSGIKAVVASQQSGITRHPAQPFPDRMNHKAVHGLGEI